MNLLPDEGVDVMVVDPETPGKDEETEVSIKEVTADEKTDDEGTGWYWKLKLKEGTRKVAVIYQYLDVWLADSPL